MSSGFYRQGANVPGKAMLLNSAALARSSTPAYIDMGASSFVPGGDFTPPDPTDIGPARMSIANAMAMGFTGDPCDNCGSMKMQRTGHCNTCAECGTTTGCS